LTTVFYILFILSCIVLIVSVLLQPGKADAGALFSSSISSTAFGPRGTQSLLAKITIGAAAMFMLVALALSLPAITGQRSVLQDVDEEETPAATPAPQASPGASPAASPAQEGANTGANPTNTAAPAETTPSPASSPATGALPAPGK
jgi:preprotein translocase subunit SecG